MPSGDNVRVNYASDIPELANIFRWIESQPHGHIVTAAICRLAVAVDEADVDYDRDQDRRALEIAENRDREGWELMSSFDQRAEVLIDLSQCWRCQTRDAVERDDEVGLCDSCAEYLRTL